MSLMNLMKCLMKGGFWNGYRVIDGWHLGNHSALLRQENESLYYFMRAFEQEVPFSCVLMVQLIALPLHG